MTPKKIYTYANAILFLFAATSFTSCFAKFDLFTKKPKEASTKEDVAIKKEELATKKTMSDKKDMWQRCYYVDRPRAFENYYCESACKNGVFVASRTPDGQMFLSINGKIVWWNKYADAEKKEPSVLINFSAGAVTDFDISYMANNIFPQITIEGPLYGICAIDPVKNPKNKRLYTFEKDTVGRYFWKLDESLTMIAQMVSAAHDGSVVVLCDDGPYQKAVDGSWKKLGTIKGVKQVAIGNKNAIFALSDKDEVLSWKDDAWTPLQTKNPKNNIRHIAVNPEGVLYCTDKTGKALYFSENEIWDLLPNISNAEQITVMDKEYCWTSQPYGNAMAKNDIIDKAIKKGTVLILDTWAISNGQKKADLGTKIIASGAVGIAGYYTVGWTVGAALLLLNPAAILPVASFIAIAALPASALFGATAFLTRAHCNKIFIRNSNAPANAPDETAPEISTTPVAPAPETAPAVTASTTVQEATPAVTTSVPATPVAPVPETPVAPDPETSPAVTTPIVPVA